MDGQRQGRTAVDAQTAPRTQVAGGGKRRRLDGVEVIEGMPADEGEQAPSDVPAGPVVPPDEAPPLDGLLPLAWGAVSTMTFAALATNTVAAQRPPPLSVPPFAEPQSRIVKAGGTASPGTQIQAKPVEEKSSAENPISEKPIPEEPIPEKPVLEKAVQEMPTLEKLVQEKPLQEEPVQERQIAGTRLQEMLVQEPPAQETSAQKALVQKGSLARQAADELPLEKIVEGRIASDEREDDGDLDLNLDLDPPPAATFDIPRVPADAQIRVSNGAATFDDAPEPVPLRRSARHSVKDEAGTRPEARLAPLAADVPLGVERVGRLERLERVERVDEPRGNGAPDGGLPPAIRPEGMTEGAHPEALARLVVVHDRGRVVGRTWSGDLVDFVLTGQPEVRLPSVAGGVEDGLVLEISRVSRDDQGVVQRSHVDVDASTALIPADLFVEGPQVFVVGARHPADAGPLRLLRVEHVWLDTQPPEAPTFRPIAQEVTDALLSVANLEDQAQLQYRAGGASDWVAALAGSNLRGPGEVRQIDRAGNAGAASELPAHQMIHVLQSVPPTSSDAVL